ncbi:unnamed protein product [Cladocopium goreaui]|uniref:Uncharacterized protein n=1 Tax=Cladocopium goreaui TaxID=2562237 RepID=A0A9P1DGQ3_9DINO|nr:unnamed protein product [Cladocopium goreaui]
MAPCTETNGFPHSDFEVKNGLLNLADPATKNGVLEPEAQDGKAGKTPAFDHNDYNSHLRELEQDPDIHLQDLRERSWDSVLSKEFIMRMHNGIYANEKKGSRSWRGAVLMKDSISLANYQRLLQRLKPGTIFDLGTAGGGSALWFADQCRALRLNTKVITLDIVDMRAAEVKQLHQDEGIEFVICDVTKAFGQLKTLHLPKPWLVSDDCHVDSKKLIAEFEKLGMDQGDYILFEDTHLATADECGMNADKPEEYTCDHFAIGKQTVMKNAMMERADDYKIDTDIQDCYGYNGARYVNSVFVRVTKAVPSLDSSCGDKMSKVI